MADTDASLPVPVEKRYNGFTVRELKLKLELVPIDVDHIEYLAQLLTEVRA